MLSRLNYLLDIISEFIAHRKGLLPILGILLIIAGILINLVSTYLSVNRYLVISEDKLYN